MSPALESLVWLVLMSVGMLLLKRWIHLHVQALGLLLTGNADGSFFLFALLFFPGTLIHELSHFLMAHFLGVRVHKVSLLPAREPGGRLRLGYVDITRTDTVREAVIGLAPLLVGTALILIVASASLPPVPAGTSLPTELSGWLTTLPRLLRTGDFLLLLYAVFTISNGMLPSESDRQAWTPIALWLGAIAAVLYLSGAVTSIPEAVDRGIADAVRWIVRGFALAMLVDIVFVPVIFLLEKMLEFVTGKRVSY